MSEQLRALLDNGVDFGMGQLIALTQSCRISRTEDNNRICKTNPNEDPVSIV